MTSPILPFQAFTYTNLITLKQNKAPFNKLTVKIVPLVPEKGLNKGH